MRGERRYMDRYSTITLNRINNIDGFFRMVDKCSQPVYVSDEEHTVDLKNNSTARNIIKAACGEGWHGLLNLKVSSADTESVLSYMM